MKSKNLTNTFWLGVFLTMLVCGAAADPRPAGMVTLDIESQPVAAALTDLAQQSGLQVLFYSDVADGAISVPALHGKFTPEQALSRLLLNTGLTYSYVNDITVAIHRAVRNVSREKSRGKAVSPFTRIANEASEGSTIAQVQQGAGQGLRREPSDGTRSKSRIEEVIVTATKRIERLQDVPISITAITADQIDSRGLVSAEDYLRSIPGVAQMDGFQGQTIVIRGLETTTSDQNSTQGPVTATYFGETPTTTSAGVWGGTNVDIKLVDIERVEVLRGPQGTAFGDGSIGGAVRTIPVAPKLDRFEGKAGVGYSATSGYGGDNYNFQGVVNLPLINDRFALRAVGYRYNESGYYRNVAGSDPTFQSTVVTPLGLQAIAVDEAEVGGSEFTGGRVAALFQASEALKFTLSYLKQKTERDGEALAMTGSYQQTLLQVAPEHRVHGHTGTYFDTDIDLANAVMEYNFGWANLLATYSYTKSGSEYSQDFSAAVPAWAVSSAFDSDHRAHAGEVRLDTQLDGAWNVLGGVYYEDMKDEGVNVPWGAGWLWTGDPAANFFNPGTTYLGSRSDERQAKQKAVFGEVSWEFLEGFTLTGGARYYDVDRGYRFDAEGLFYRTVHRQVDTDASGTTFRANLSYKPDPDALLYASWAQGFRLGNPQKGLLDICDANGDGIADALGIPLEATRIVNSDATDSYELGGKFALLERRMAIDADVFRVDWSDIPVTVSGGNGCPLLYVANAGDARSQGVELQIQYQIAEPIRVDVGGSYIHSRLTGDVPSIGGKKGDKLPGSGDINWNLGLQYQFNIAGQTPSVRLDAMYVSPSYTFITKEPAPETLKAGDYILLNASVRVPLRNTNVDLFVRNLTNEDAFTYRGTGSANGFGPFYGWQLRPRTIGLQLSVNF